MPDFLKRPIIAISLLAAISMAGCAATSTPLPEADSQAAQLYQSRCSICHSVPHPARHTFNEWQHTLKLMERRMAEKNMVVMSATDKQAILAYLQDHSR